MGWSHGARWLDSDIEGQLRQIVGEVGRMPSMPELFAAGKGPLANVIARRGGAAAWAERVGAEMKDSETLRGHRWEAYTKSVLIASGRSAERQTCRAPFDLLVGGRCRVNVKSAKLSRYKGAGPTFYFGLGKSWRECDVFALVRANGDAPAVLWVPATELRQQTLSLTATNRFNEYTAIGIVDIYP